MGFRLGRQAMPPTLSDVPTSGPVGTATNRTFRDRWSRPAAVLAGAISGLLMVSRLDALSLTGDEGFTAQMVRLPWATMMSDLGRVDYNMSLHYIVLRAWSGIFGTGEPSLRFPSVIAVLVALYLLYILVSRLFGQRLAAFSVIVLALNPFFIRFGLTARPYAFLILWSVAATLTLVRALDTPSRRWWLLYGCMAIIGLHVHMTALLVVCAHGLFALVHQRRLTRLNLESLALIVTAGLLPTLFFLAPSDTLKWIGPFTPGAAMRAIYGLGGRFPFAWVVLGLALVGVFSVPRTHRMTWLPAVWLTVPVATCLVLAPLQSLFVADYFSGVVAPLSIVAAFGVDRLLGRFRTLALPIALAIGAGVLAVGVVTGGLNHGQAWRELVPIVANVVQPGEAVAFPNAYYRIVSAYYSEDPLEGPFPAGTPVLPSDPWGTLSPYDLNFISLAGVQDDHEVFEPQALAWDRIWVVALGDRFEAALIEDLISHGYQEVQDVRSESAIARLYVLQDG